jgi:hypothetical protein
LTDEELRVLRELLKAKVVTQSVVIFVKVAAKYLAALAAGYAAYKFLLADLIGVKH